MGTNLGKRHIPLASINESLQPLSNENKYFTFFPMFMLFYDHGKHGNCSKYKR